MTTSTIQKKIMNINKIAYGGDYNPEQWPKEVWQEDMRLFRLAGIDTVTLNVFSWAKLQPSEETYDFAQLDEIINTVTENGMNICLATSTAAHPAWMARKYPEILRVDNQGRKRKFGGRHNSCPNSKVYREMSVKLATKLAERYKNQTNIVAWHISNEYGGDCYCENCEKAFRIWLKDRYKTIDALNKAWNTSFWSHTFYDWDEIVLPNVLTEHFEAYDRDRTMFQGITIDYKRFNSDSMMECYKLERDAVKAITPDIPVTTNLMGFYNPLDYRKWAKHMDFISWDNYPGPDDSPALMAMNHELMKGLKDGMPFCLMEQTPSVTNWQPYNKLKRPGVMRLWSYQAVAHGSDTIMFFQMRRSVGACEKFHGAVIDHAGHENTRVFREITELGKELISLGHDDLGQHILGSTTDAKVAIVFDWENWWGTNYTAGPSILIDYYKETLKYYEAFHALNISTDIIGIDSDLSKYSVVITPILYMVRDHYDEKLREFVKNGGSLVATYFSGYVNESDLIFGAYPGPLKDIFGIWVEESDALRENETNCFELDNIDFTSKVLCDIIHTEGAETLSVYKDDFYKGSPVITKNSYGDGKAYYVGTSSDANFYMHFAKKLASVCGVESVCEIIASNPAPNQDILSANLEITKRVKILDTNKCIEYIFVLNHSDKDIEAVIPFAAKELLSGNDIICGQQIVIKKKDVLIFGREKELNK